MVEVNIGENETEPSQKVEIDEKSKDNNRKSKNNNRFHSELKQLNRELILEEMIDIKTEPISQNTYAIRIAISNLQADLKLNEYLGYGINYPHTLVNKRRFLVDGIEAKKVVGIEETPSEEEKHKAEVLERKGINLVDMNKKKGIGENKQTIKWEVQITFRDDKGTFINLIQYIELNWSKTVKSVGRTEAKILQKIPEDANPSPNESLRYGEKEKITL